MTEKYKYFEELKKGGKLAIHIKESMKFLLSLEDRNTLAIQTSYHLLRGELEEIEKRAKLYKLTDNINPRGEEIHIPKVFCVLMDSEEIDGSLKFYAQMALSDLNDYCRYINRLSIERNKYPKHRRDIHKLDNDIKLPKTPKEILKRFEDQAKQIDPDGYGYFLKPFGFERSPQKNPMEKFTQKLIKSFERR